MVFSTKASLRAQSKFPARSALVLESKGSRRIVNGSEFPLSFLFSVFISPYALLRSN